jgi:hypothetical protein
MPSVFGVFFVIDAHKIPEKIKKKSHLGEQIQTLTISNTHLLSYCLKPLLCAVFMCIMFNTINVK